VGGLGIKRRTVLCVVTAILIAASILTFYVPPANSCYGPCIISDTDKTECNINETVTITGQICPPAENHTVRIAFTRPDYTYVEQYLLTDPASGNFSCVQQLDQAGCWNIFAIDGHICDRIFVSVTDPENLTQPSPTPKIPLTYKPNYSVITITAIGVSVGLVAVFLGTRNKTRTISSLRLFVQVGLLLLIFFGIFIDHNILPVPAGEIAPHEALVEANVLGVSMPDGLPAPFFGCYYPCGKTVTCALWQIQTYIYPFSNVGGGWGVDYVSSGIMRLAVVFGIIIFAAVLLGRFFCGWVCPFGLYLDLMTRLRKALKIKRRNISDKQNQYLHQLSYILLASLIILSVIFGSQAIAGAQLVPGTEQGGFVWTYFSAPFCQVCPMKPLCILAETGVGLMRPGWIVQNTTGQFLQLGFYLTSVNLVILAIVTAAAFFFRRSWCRICPLGGLIALFNRFKPFKWISGVRLNKAEEKCTKCGICKRVCPTQVRGVYDEKSGDVADSQCIYCLRCVEMCPNKDCLQFKFLGKTVCRSRNWLIKSDSLKGE
jgi:ferredoxin-type protein NapH